MITKADLQGHWRRDSMTAPGFTDCTTRVHWMQAGSLFADLRIPVDRPDLTGCTCLADLSPPALAQLMQAEGFAGTITVADDRCTWHRKINWHGVPGQDDVGLMCFENGALIEDGVLAEYRERWLPEPGDPLRGRLVSIGDQNGVLIENDTGFLVAIGSTPSGNSKQLIADLNTGVAAPEAVRHQFASTYCLGRWDGNVGVARLSTNPFCEGMPVLRRERGFLWSAPDFGGEVVTSSLAVAKHDQTY